ncbi:ATPase, AAA-type, core, P-loop containing nucleoside triphosphate hydrolase [Tanacetum coccineum]
MDAIKPSVSIQNFKIGSLMVRQSGPSFPTYRTASTRLVPILGSTKNATTASFHCCCIKEENHVDTITSMHHFYFFSLFAKVLIAYPSSEIIKFHFLNSAIIIKELKNVTFNRLMGVDDIILIELKDIISILHGQSESKKFRSKLPNGVLLYGPRRNGKTTLVHAMAREARVPFFPIYADDIIVHRLNKNVLAMPKPTGPSAIQKKAHAKNKCSSYGCLGVSHVDMWTRMKMRLFASWHGEFPKLAAMVDISSFCDSLHIRV